MELIKKEDSNLRSILVRKGFIVAKNVFSEIELKSLKGVTRKLIKDWANGNIRSEDFWEYEDDAKERILYRIHNFEKHFERIFEVIKRPKFQELLKSVFGKIPEPTVFACIIKMPFKGAEVPWHKDPIKVEAQTVYNFSIYLDESTFENGCLQAVPYSHNQNFNINKEEIGLMAEPIPANIGDVVIHDVRTFHGSAFSFSPKLRRSIVIEFK